MEKNKEKKRDKRKKSRKTVDHSMVDNLWQYCFTMIFMLLFRKK